MPRSKRMKHFSHSHDLYLIEVRRQNLNSICFGCNGNLSLSDSCYTCFQCTDFFLHKCCFEVPQSLQHKAHPKHTLGLLFPPLSSGTCNACGEACNSSFSYNCTLCNFNLHVNCATSYEKQEDVFEEIASKIEVLTSRLQQIDQEEQRKLAEEKMEQDLMNLQHEQTMLYYKQQMKFSEESIDRMGQIK